MTDQNDPKPHGEFPVETALGLIGNEIRAKILWTFSKIRGGENPPPVLSFSELRERAAPDIDSGQFNYHLQQLLGNYIEYIDQDMSAEDTQQPVPSMAGQPTDGYRLTPEGTMFVRMLRAWSTEDDPSIESKKMGLSCYYCGTTVEAFYESAHFVIQCPDCEYLYDYNPTPPGVLEGDWNTVLSQVARYNRQTRLTFAQGGCPYCGNTVQTEWIDPDTTGYPRRDYRKALVGRGCDYCGNTDFLNIGELLLRDPYVISFLLDQGLDVTTTPIWELEFAATDRCTTVQSDDPWEVAITITRDGNQMTTVVGEQLEIKERSVTE